MPTRVPDRSATEPGTPGWMRYVLLLIALGNVAWVVRYGGGADGGLVWFLFIVNSSILGLAYWKFFGLPGRRGSSAD